MTRFEILAVLALPFSGLLLSGCSAGGSDSSGGGAVLFVQTCSLGCNNGLNADEVTCDVTVVALNEQFSILFSEAIDPSSLTPQTFRIEEVGVGSVPDGIRTVDEDDPRRIIFRPAVNFVGGAPEYAFTPNALYEITVPGAQDGGDRIRSVSGRLNQTRVSCTIRPTADVIDLRPGPPTYEVFVDRIDPMTGQIVPDVPADGQDNIHIETRVRIVFEDIMNPATLGSGTMAGFIRISADEDGNEFTTNDQTDISGTFQPAILLDELRTILTFIPASTLPSVGTAGTRRILVFIPPAVQDLAGNPVVIPLDNMGVPDPYTIFGTQIIPATPIVFSEDFDDVDNLDQGASGAEWGEDMVLGGRLIRGFGGGSGRLGSLVVSAGETLILSADNQTFPLIGTSRSLLDNSVPGTDYDPTDSGTWPIITVTDGIFEFDRLEVQTGATLIFQGVNHARVFARGELIINGVLDLSGGSVQAQNSGLVYSVPGGLGGPAGGDGGSGATRINNNANTTLLGIPTLAALDDASFPGDVPLGLVAGADQVDGQDGLGVGREVGGVTRGRGGLHFPDVLPTVVSTIDSMIAMGEGARFSLIPVGVASPQCRIAQVAQPGSGGAYASDGGLGVAVADPVSIINHFVDLAQNFPPGSQEFMDSFSAAAAPPNAAEPSLGGDSTGFIDPAARTLNTIFGAPPYGALRGGAGGGGGGVHLSYTGHKSCNAGGMFSLLAGTNAVFSVWYDHSAGSGGGGGGALQIVGGTRVVVNGLINATGGDGGSSVFPAATYDNTNCSPSDFTITCGDFASPGGGGAGGAIRIQSREITLAPQPGLLDVSGGLGGQGATGSIGGDGGHGLVRIEDAPEDPMDAISLADVLAVTAPDQSGAPSAEVATKAAWDVPRMRPESYSGSVSCWLEPGVASFLLDFSADTDPTDPAQQGWNIDVLYEPVPGNLQVWKYRGVPSDAGFPFGSMSFQEVLGNSLNHGLADDMGSYVSVRFQGARAISGLSDPCNVDLESSPQIVPLSATPWVQHPAELNQFSPRPNIIRVSYVFDTSMLIGSAQNKEINLRIRGLTNLTINATAD